MRYGIGRSGRFGIWDVKDWVRATLESFPAPWSLSPREGKHYGTVICDYNGRELLSIWNTASGKPSRREIEYFGEEYSEAAWAEYCSDSHWESAEDLEAAERIVAARQAGELPDEEIMWIVKNCQWMDQAWPYILCGGPDKRRLTA